MPAIRLLGIAGVPVILCLISLPTAHAQTDEIQVYTGEINKPANLALRYTTTTRQTAQRSLPSSVASSPITR